MATSVPETMRAVVIDRFGGPEELQLRDMPVPQPEPGELLIKLDTIGVASWDPLERAGEMAAITQGEPKFPYILGTDGGGVVEAVGEGVDGFAPGERVYAIGFLSARGGFYREYAVASADKSAKVPAGLDAEQAGAMGSAAVTAFQGVEKLGPGKGDIAIVGASGDVGQLALQFAKAHGRRVFAVASGADGAGVARELGADLVVDRKRGDVAAELAAFAPGGLDGALLFAGGDAADAVAKAVKSGGPVVAPEGVEPAPEGVARYNGEPDRATLDRMNAVIEKGRFEFRIAERFPLARAADAHAALDGHRVGKIVLKPGD